MQLKAFKIFIASNNDIGVETKLYFAKSRRSLKIPEEIKSKVYMIMEVTDDVKDDIQEVKETIKDTVVEDVLEYVGLL